MRLFLIIYLPLIVPLCSKFLHLMLSQLEIIMTLYFSFLNQAHNIWWRLGLNVFPYFLKVLREINRFFSKFFFDTFGADHSGMFIWLVFFREVWFFWSFLFFFLCLWGLLCFVLFFWYFRSWSCRRVFVFFFLWSIWGLRGGNAKVAYHLSKMINLLLILSIETTNLLLQHALQWVIGHIAGHLSQNLFQRIVNIFQRAVKLGFQERVLLF